MKKWSETEKTHTFFLKIGEKMMQKWMLFEVRHEVFEREKWERQWTVTKIRRKNWKTILKTVFKMQNMRFLRLIQVASQLPGSLAKTLQAKSFEKICQVFFVIGSFTREGVASWATKISVYPLRLDLPLANKSPKPTRELTTGACDLDDPRLSRQSRATLFLKFFLVFVKTKYFSKKPKTLKNRFVFESTKIEHVKTHFIKYNHTNEYDIHWT